MRRDTGRSQAGFSIVEALIAIGVILLIAVIGIPNFINQWRKIQLEAAAENIANVMSQTRIRAIRDNAQYDVDVEVEVDGTEWVVGQAAYGAEELELKFDAPVSLYAGGGPAVCLNKYDGTGDTFDSNTITYQNTGVATGTGAICIHDGLGNVLQIVVRFPTAQPKIRKFLLAGDSPTGNVGFFEKTGFNVASEAVNIWVWY